MATGTHPEGLSSPALVFETLLSFQRTAALRAAIELNLFRAVGEGPGGAPSLARQCSASERGIRILCDYLTIMGLLVKDDGRCRHSSTSAAFLDPRSPLCVASVARFIGNPAMSEPHQHLADIVRRECSTSPRVTACSASR